MFIIEQEAFCFWQSKKFTEIPQRLDCLVRTTDTRLTFSMTCTKIYFFLSSPSFSKAFFTRVVFRLRAVWANRKSPSFYFFLFFWLRDRVKLHSNLPDVTFSSWVCLCSWLLWETFYFFSCPLSDKVYVFICCMNFHILRRVQIWRHMGNLLFPTFFFRRPQGREQAHEWKLNQASRSKSFAGISLVRPTNDLCPRSENLHERENVFGRTC